MEMCREKGEESSDEEQEQAGEPKGGGLALTALSGSQLSLEKRRGPISFKPHRAGFRDRAGPLNCGHHCHRRGRIVFRCRGSREDVAFCPAEQWSMLPKLSSCLPLAPSAPLSRVSTPLASGRRCDGDQVEFHLFCCLCFPPSTIAIAVTNMAELALVSEFFSAQVLQEPSVHSHPAHHGTSGGIRLGAACCCGGGRRGRWCAVFAFEAACPSTRCHQSLAALARPFFSPPSPFPVLNKTSRVPASGCIGWHGERKKKPQEARSDICCCLPTDIVVSPSLGPMHPAAQVWPEKGGGWKGGKSIVLRHTNQKRSGSGEGGDGDFRIQRHLPMQVVRAVGKTAVGREVHDAAD